MDKGISWLLEEEDPAVRYRTLTELLGRSKDETEVQEAYRALMASEQLSAVMDKFQLNDKWEHMNAFLALTEFGLTREDVVIDEYVERIIHKLNRSTKCAKILLLRNLTALGYYDHPWVQNEIETAFQNIREDGTVHCLDAGKKRNDSRLPEMGCYRQTTTYLLLAAELKKKGMIRPEYDRLIGFYLDHNVMFHAGEPEKLIIKEMTGTFFPIDHVHIGLQIILYGLSVLGSGNHPSLNKAWELLHSYKDSDENYILTDSFDQPYFDAGTVGKPNKWVTLYCKLAQKYCTK